MNVHVTTRRLMLLSVVIISALATCARCIQSAPTVDVGPGTDPSGPWCGPDDEVGPERDEGGTALCAATARTHCRLAGRSA